MNHFELRQGALWCEETPLADIAEAEGTPVYVYSSATLERHWRVFAQGVSAEPELAGALIAYAVKANGNLSVLSTLARLGAGADTVSEGEILRALRAGIRPDHIVFSGVAKTGRELALALDAGVGQINVESEPELRRLAAVAAARRVRAPVALRVNPDVGAGGHAKITTGGGESKFGVSAAEAHRLYAQGAAEPWLHMRGLACHIGSQIVDLAPLEAAWGRLAALTRALRSDGLTVERLDLGGGLGVPDFDHPDPPPPRDLARAAGKAVAGLEVQAVFEPGRVICANAGVLLCRVVHVHERPEGQRFLVLDAGMNDLIRPAMYDAWHDIRPVRPRRGAPAAYDVVGPVCESSDTFARARPLPPMHSDDLVVFMTAGAYGAAMASEYNTRPLVPEALVRGATWSVVRRRPSYEEMFAREPLAPWLEG